MQYFFARTAIDFIIVTILCKVAKGRKSGEKRYFLQVCEHHGSTFIAAKTQTHGSPVTLTPTKNANYLETKTHKKRHFLITRKALSYTLIIYIIYFRYLLYTFLCIFLMELFHEFLRNVCCYKLHLYFSCSVFCFFIIMFRFCTHVCISYPFFFLSLYSCFTILHSVVFSWQHCNAYY